MQFDPNYLIKLVAAVNQSSSAESALTTELSSGLRVSSLQVDPSAAAQSSRLASAIAKDDSYVKAASSQQAILQVTDSALGEVVTQLTSALSLAVQGSNGTQNASNTAVVAQQLSAIRDAVVSLANTSFMGTYLFGGSMGLVQPYSTDTSTTPATAVYAGDTAVQSITTPNGQQIQTSLPGPSIFGSGSSGVLAALNQLVADFSSGTVSPTVTSDMAALTAALGQVSSQRGVLGSSLNRIQSASTYAQTDEATLTARQSSLVSSDLTLVATQLKSAETQHQALLSVMAALGSTNLFSFMK
ncbi:MAG: flagellar hook-associated protein 3 [Acidobacteriaceae bacterium]|nr:flagellar hook-associated protein 3 [Acidobacteriaceae bacterium]